jgi:hypothetical protein
MLSQVELKIISFLFKYMTLHQNQFIFPQLENYLIWLECWTKFNCQAYNIPPYAIYFA